MEQVGNPSRGMLLWSSLFGKEYICELILAQLIIMYATTGLSRILLFYSTPRTQSLPLRRQQQLYTVLPVLLVKAIIVSQIWFDLTAEKGRTKLPPEEGGDIIHYYRFMPQLCFSYIYELLQRSSSPNIIGHHLIVQILPFYTRFYLVYQPIQQIELVLGFFERMALLGPGLSNIIADFVFLLYYLSPRTSSGCIIIMATCCLAHVVRAVQWIVLSWYLWTNASSAVVGLLNSWERIIFSISGIIWFWLQVEEILRLSGMARRFRETVKQKSD